MKVGKLYYSPDYRAPRVRVVRSQDLSRCEWCGRSEEVEKLRPIEIRGKVFKVCPRCPPPDNANAMRV